MEPSWTPWNSTDNQRIKKYYLYDKSNGKHNEPEKLTFDFPKFLGGLTICAFLLGILYPLIYYSFFGFNIFDYIELSELATHTIKDGVTIIVPYFLFYMVGFVYGPEKPIVLKMNAYPQGWFWKNSKYIFRIAYVILAGLLLWQYLSARLALPMLLFLIVSFLAAYILDFPSLFKNRLLLRTGMSIGSFEYFFILALSITVYGGIAQGLIKADSVKYGHATKGSYVILTKGDTLKSTDTHFYIGSTNKKVFFYDMNVKGVEIIPETEIKQVFLK